MIALYLCDPQVTCYANDNDAFIPEIWAMESLEILEENMTIANLVHRDFTDEVAQFGEVVNTRRPGEFKIKRKTDSDNVVDQDATAANVQVALDQHFYETFIIKDGESTKSFAELVQTHLNPAALSVARGIDRALLGRTHDFLSQGSPDQRAGKLLGLTKSNAQDTLLEAIEIMDRNKAFAEGRNLMVSPKSRTPFLSTDLFVSAEKRGDAGTALRTASMGSVFGVDFFMAQNVSSLTDLATERAEGTVTNAASAGTTGSQAVSVTGYVANVGEYAVMAGNDQPTYITAKTDNGTDTTAVTLNEALKNDVSASAVIKIYKAAAVNGARAVGYQKEINIDGFAADKGPQVGQIISFGTGSNRRTYTIIETESVSSTEVKVLLDRPLEVALSDNDLAFPGPAGGYNLLFHRNALALVTRPLASPRAGTGAAASVASKNGVGMRAVMTYDGVAQGTRVTLDLLAGTAILDTDLATVLLGQ